MLKMFLIERGKMGWLLSSQAQCYKSQRARSWWPFHLSEQRTWERKPKTVHNKNASTKEAMRKKHLQSVGLKELWWNARALRCTGMLFNKWCLTTAAKVRESRPVMAEEQRKAKTHSKRHCKFYWSPWDPAQKPLFASLLKATRAREPWHDFHLRKKVFDPGPAGAWVSEQHRELFMPGGKLWAAAVKRNQELLPDQLLQYLEDMFPWHWASPLSWRQLWSIKGMTSVSHYCHSSNWNVQVGTGILQGEYLMTFKNWVRSTNAAEAATSELLCKKSLCNWNRLENLQTKIQLGW